MGGTNIQNKCAGLHFELNFRVVARVNGSSEVSSKENLLVLVLVLVGRSIEPIAIAFALHKRITELPVILH